MVKCTCHPDDRPTGVCPGLGAASECWAAAKALEEQSPPQQPRTLEEQVRYLIGEGGPQLPSVEYECRIDDVIDNMSNAELLRWISLAVEDMRHG
jgi:hypothetical protein